MPISLVRGRRPAARVAAGALVAAALAGCEAPSVPTWDTNLTLPVTAETRTLAEMVEGSDTFIIDSLGTVALAVVEPLDPVRVDDALVLDPFTDQSAYALGALEIATPAPRRETYRFDELWGGAAGVDGRTEPVPPFAFRVARALDAFVDAEWAVFARADLEVTVTNRLAVPLGPLTLALLDPGSGAVLSTRDAGTIAAGTTAVLPWSLAGARVERSTQLEVAGTSPGSNGQAVLVVASSTVEVEVRFVSAPAVSEMLGPLPAQTVVRSLAVDLDPGSRVEAADFRSGDLGIALSNGTGAAAEVEIVFPELEAANGDTLRVTDVLAAGGSRVIVARLAGSHLAPRLPTQVEARLVARVRASTEPIHVASTQSVAATFVLSEPAELERFTGVLERREIAIAPQTRALDLPDGLDGLEFSRVTLTIAVDNEVEMPIDLDLVLDGRAAGGTLRSLHVRETVARRGGSDTTSRTTIVLDESDPELLAFMNNVPATVTVGGTAIVGDGVTRGSAERGESVGGELRLEAPMEVAIRPSRVTTDPSRLDLDPDVRSTIRDDVRSGRLVARFTNHVPCGATIHLVVSRQAGRANDLDDPANLVFSARLDPARLGPDGLVSEGTVVSTSFDLDRADLRIFEEAPLFVATVIDLEGTEGRAVRFMGSDYLGAESYLVLATRVAP